MTYIWAREGWPLFRFDLQGVQGVLYRYATEANALKGSVAHLDDEEQTEALIDLVVSEAITTSAIEGEDLDRQRRAILDPQPVRAQPDARARPRPARSRASPRS